MKKTHTKQSRTHSALRVEEAVSLFFSVKQIIRTHLAQGKKRNPSAWLRVETLKFIADHHKPQMKDIADYLSITAPSTTSLVAGLVADGLVASHADPSDRRSSRLALTKKGKAELQKNMARGMRLLEELFSSLSKKELEDFTTALARIKEKNTEE